MFNLIKNYIIPIIIGLGFFGYLYHYANEERTRSCAEVEAQLKQTAKIVSSVISSYIKTELTSDNTEIDTSRLKVIVKELMQSSNLIYFCFKKKDTVLLNIPSTAEVTLPIESKEGSMTLDDIIYFWYELDFSSSPCIKCESTKTSDPCKKRELANGYKIQLGYPLICCLNANQVSNKKFYLTVFAGAFAVILFIASSIYSIHHYSLLRKVDILQGKNEQLEELNIAASGLAHETKNPLGIMRGLAQRIHEEKASRDDIPKMAGEIIEQADITTDRLGDFMNYAKLRKAELNKVEVKDHIEKIVEMLKPDFEDAEITIESDIESISILADTKILTQVLTNLLLNSLNASKSGDKVSVLLKSSGKNCTLIVEDSGSGMEESTLENIFKPYFTKTPGGHGIGLAVVKKCIDESGWKISVDSMPDKGTRMTISNIKVEA